ncbi:MAG: hypothetical protein FWF22_02760, partial [Treponema sp.]|nr:hypothetical protein [Treponema sp.]
EWAAGLKTCGLYDLYMDCAAARFSPDFTEEDWQKMKVNYSALDSAIHRNIPLLLRLVAWVIPPLALALPGIRRHGKNGAKFLIVVFLVFLIYPGQAQNSSASSALLLEANTARDAENWEKAVELYTQGSKLYPDDIDFPRSLGDLFYGRNLYRLAWNEYRLCEKISPYDFDNMFQLARTAGYLNMNEVSAQYLEKVLSVNPDDREAISSLGWMYFKIHRLRDGERLLLSAIDRIGSDPDFAMTLGTLYSDMFNYAEAKKWYMQAITSAESTGDWVFSAVARYNLSILESRFYEFDQAYEQANLSLNSVNRSSGRLARGELFLRRMELSRTLAEYQDSYDMDTSPLSKLNLAEALQIGGRLDEARLYAEDCLNGSDLSWMVNFGIDPDRYKMEIHEILQKIYEGLENSERFKAPINFWDRFLQPLRILAYRFRAEVHGQLYRKYCLLCAQTYGDDQGSIHQDALIQLYNALEPYPRRALDYLREARDFEEPLIPRSVPSYDLEEGVLLGNQNLILQALDNFDQFWERDQIAKAYSELAAKGPLAKQAAEDLFAINPGALQQSKIKLDVNLVTDTIPAKTAKILEQAVKAAGINVAAKNARYTLTLSGEDDIVCELYDYNQRIFRQQIKLPSADYAGMAVFSRALRDQLFNGFWL